MLNHAASWEHIGQPGFQPGGHSNVKSPAIICIISLVCPGFRSLAWIYILAGALFCRAMFSLSRLKYTEVTAGQIFKGKKEKNRKKNLSTLKRQPQNPNVRCMCRLFGVVLGRKGQKEHFRFGCRLELEGFVTACVFFGKTTRKNKKKILQSEIKEFDMNPACKSHQQP